MTLGQIEFKFRAPPEAYFATRPFLKCNIQLLQCAKAKSFSFLGLHLSGTKKVETFLDQKQVRHSEKNIFRTTKTKLRHFRSRLYSL